MEVMIFLAISGFMFIIAAAFISGKQSKAEFKQGMNDVASQIQQVINYVGNGFYPSANFTCTPNSGGPTFNSGSNPQGTNQGCILLGQVIQFGVPGTNDTGYNIYTVVGNQYSNGTITGPDLSTGFSDAHPTAVYDPSHNVDITDSKILQWGLQVTGMYNKSTAIGAVGFFGSFGSYNGITLASGSQATTVATVPNSALEQTKDQVAKQPGSEIYQIADANVIAQPDITICFKNGSQKGSITIGGSIGQRLTVNEELGNSVAGICP